MDASFFELLLGQNKTPPLDSYLSPYTQEPHCKTKITSYIPLPFCDRFHHSALAMAMRNKVLFFIFLFLLFASELFFPTTQARPLKVQEDIDLLNAMDHLIGDQLLEGIKIGGRSEGKGRGFGEYHLDEVKNSGPSPGDGH